MTYEQRLSAQADAGKCPGSTFERKTMSSTIKRVALVAVAALGLGSVTAISANATVPTLFKFVTAESIGTDTDTAVTVAGPSNYVEIGSKVDSSAAARVDVSGAGATFVDITEAQTAGGGATAPTATVSYNTAATSATMSGNDIYGSAATEYIKLRINTPTAGTVTIKVVTTALVNGVSTDTLVDTLTVTVNAAATAGTLSVANSTSILDADALATAHDATSDATVSVVKTAAQYAGVVKLTLKDVNNVVMPNTTSLSAVVTGPGIVSLNTTQASATYQTGGRAVSATTSSGVIYAAIYGDGNAGVSTVTFSVGTTVVATETVTFYGSVASLTATVKKSVIANSGAGTSAAIAVVAKDAAGVVVPSQSLTITSSDSTIASASGTSASASEAAAGTATITVTGASAKYGNVTLTIKFSDTVSTTAAVTVADVKVNAAKLSFDKDEYAPGEKATLTISATDANGLPVADGDATSVLTGALASSAGVTSTLSFNATATTVSFAGGKASVSFYMPLVAGTFNVSGTLGAAGTYVTSTAAGAALAASVNVVESNGGTSAAIDAANEATDAANAATDAANAAAEAADAATAAAQDAQAAVAALATQVASLIAGIKAQITTLTNLVIKIQKKVRA
jgi:hypothetical protein